MAIDIYNLLGFPLLCTNQNVEGNLVTVSEQNDDLDFEPFYQAEFGQLEFEGYLKRNT